MNTDDISALMVRVTTGVMAALLLMPAAAGAQALDISRSGSRTTRQAQQRTSRVWLASTCCSTGSTPADASGGVVTSSLCPDRVAFASGWTDARRDGRHGASATVG